MSASGCFQTSPEEQKALIKAEMAKPAVRACYMIHKQWWDAWKKHVNFDGTESETTQSPTYITNDALVYCLLMKSWSLLR